MPGPTYRNVESECAVATLVLQRIPLLSSTRNGEGMREASFLFMRMSFNAGALPQHHIE